MKLKHLFEMNYGSLIDAKKYNDMGAADQALYKYTADGFVPPFGSNYKDLEEKYPFDGGTLYRGLLFSEEEKFEKFMNNIKDGKIVMEDSSSWTPSVSTAIDFAKSEKTYFPTHEIMAAYSATQKAGDHMSGEGGGVVLKTVVPKGIGIDVNKTDYAKESEVILPSGEYEIEVHRVLRPFRTTHSTAEKAREMADELAQYAKTGEGDKKEMEKYAVYLEKSWLDELSPEQVDAIILTQHPLNLDKAVAKINSKDFIDYSYISNDNFMEGLHLRCGIYSPVNDTLFNAASDDVQQKVIKFVELQLEKIEDELPDIIEKMEDQLETGKFVISTIDITGFHEAVALDTDLDDRISDVLRPLQKFFAKVYHKFNSREYNKTLKSDDLRNHAKHMGALVKAMASLS